MNSSNAMHSWALESRSGFRSTAKKNLETSYSIALLAQIHVHLTRQGCRLHQPSKKNPDPETLLESIRSFRFNRPYADTAPTAITMEKQTSDKTARFGTEVVDMVHSDGCLLCFCDRLFHVWLDCACRSHSTGE